MSKDERLRKRIKKILAIIFPLIYSSMERIDVISNAMELRGFGKHRKRTWYAIKKATMLDYICVAVIVLFVGGIFYYTIQSGTRFYNPFKQRTKCVSLFISQDTLFDEMKKQSRIFIIDTRLFFILLQKIASITKV